MRGRYSSRVFRVAASRYDDIWLTGDRAHLRKRAAAAQSELTEAICSGLIGNISIHRAAVRPAMLRRASGLVRKQARASVGARAARARRWVVHVLSKSPLVVGPSRLGDNQPRVTSYTAA